MKKSTILLLLLSALTLACNLPFQITFNSPQPQPTASDLALTVTAQAQLIAEANNAEPENAPSAAPNAGESPDSTATNTPISLPTTTPSPVASPTPAKTATPDKPIASVSVDTNCRTGPGQVYDIVGALLVGESTEVTGKNTSSDYWIVKNPDSPTTTCWLWGQYATLAGNQAVLPEVGIPPTPTPSIPAAPSNLSETSICSDYQTMVSSYISEGTLNWQDNSNNEDGFKIYRLNGFVQGAGYYVEATVGPNVTSYSYNAGHYGVPNSVKFKVEAFNSAGAASSGEVSPNMSGCP